MPTYMKIDGIEGDATHQDHVGWTDISSCHLGAHRNITTSAGSTANREASEPIIENVVITKVSDTSSTKLLSEAVVGKTGKTVTIHMVTTGSPGEMYKELVLTDTLVASYSMDTSGDRPVETIELNFTKIEMKYVGRDGNNKPKPPQLMSYDMKTTLAS